MLGSWEMQKTLSWSVMLLCSKSLDSFLRCLSFHSLFYPILCTRCYSNLINLNYSTIFLLLWILIYVQPIVQHLLVKFMAFWIAMIKITKWFLCYVLREWCAEYIILDYCVMTRQKLQFTEQSKAHDVEFTCLITFQHMIKTSRITSNTVLFVMFYLFIVPLLLRYAIIAFRMLLIAPVPSACAGIKNRIIITTIKPSGFVCNYNFMLLLKFLVRYLFVCFV